MVRAPASENRPATTHAASCRRGWGTARATSPAVANTAEPTMTPTFTMVASKGPSARGRAPEAAEPGDGEGGFTAGSVPQATAAHGAVDRRQPGRVACFKLRTGVSHGENNETLRRYPGHPAGDPAAQGLRR